MPHTLKNEWIELGPLKLAFEFKEMLKLIFITYLFIMILYNEEFFIVEK